MSATEQQYVVRVIENETGDIAFESKPTYERRADRIEDGLLINLNHEKFHTEIVPYPEIAKG